MKQAVFIKLSIMMFLEFFIWGTWGVSLGGFMAANGMGDVIYLAYTVGPIAAIVSPFFLGMIADRFFATERVLATMNFLGAGAMLGVGAIAATNGTAAELKWWFIALLLVHMLCYMPTLGLTNTLAFHNLTNQAKQFPLIRVFGTLGWIAANWVTGLIGDKTVTQFYVTAGAAVALGVFSFYLPHTPPPAKGQKASVRQILGLDALALMKQKSFAVFVIASFLTCIPLAAYFSYANVYVGDVGFSRPTTTMSFGQVAEVVFMVVMPLFFAFLGVKWMLLMGMLAWVVRYGLFSAAAGNEVLWMVVVGILLHGICYDFFFVTGFIYADKKAPKEIRGQAQGLLVLITQGLGMVIGTLVIGQVVKAYMPQDANDLRTQAAKLMADAAGKAPEIAQPIIEQAAQMARQANELTNWTAIWLVPCILAAAVAAFFLIFFKDDGKTAETSDAHAAEVGAGH